MKLKKILASLTAAALAVTTMAIAPVSVSAAGFPYSIPEWTDSANIPSADIGTAEDENKAGVFFKYQSIDTALGYSSIKINDTNWKSCLDVSLPTADEDTYASGPVEYSKVSGGAIAQGYNLKLTAAEIKYKTKSSGSIDKSISWDPDGHAEISADMIDSDAETIVINYTCNGDSYSQIKVCSSNWGTEYGFSNVSNTDKTNQLSWAFDLNNYDGTGLVLQGHNVTIKSIDSYVSTLGVAPPYEGKVIELPKNVWDEGWNWQCMQPVTQDQFASGISMSDVLDKASTVKISFKVNGATAGTNLDYDVSQISWQINVKCHKGSEWPWLTGGTSTYENGIVTVTADISSIIEAKSAEDKKDYGSADYIFDALNLIGAAANTSADDKIKVYYEDMKISLEKTVPATKVTVTPTEMELVEGERAALKAAAEPANTTDTITFSSSAPEIASVGAASGEVTAVAEGTAVITAKANDKVFAKCTVTVKKGTQTVTVKANNDTYGTASADKTEAAEGETVTLTATPNKGYKFVEWQSEDVTVAENGTFVMPAKPVTVTAVFEQITYDVKVTSDENGTASADKAKAAEGDTVKLTAEPAGGYMFDKWTVVSGEVTLAEADSPNTAFVMPASAVEIKAVFAEIPANSYAVTVRSAEGGTANASAKSAEAGTKITLTATPDKGYQLDKWVVSPETVVIENNEFTMPESAVTITPVFGKINYSIKTEATAGGTVTAGKTTAQMGDIVTVTAAANEGYKLESVTVNGIALTGTTFEMPAEDVVIRASFKEEGSAAADIEAPEGVNISFAGSTESILAAVFGEEYAKLVEEGYKLDVVMTVKDEKSVPDTDKTLITDSLAEGQNVGLILDVALIKTVNGTSEAIAEAKSPISFVISVPDSIIAEDREYSVVRIHDGKAQNIGGKYDSTTKSITVSSALFSTYAIVYEDTAEEIIDDEDNKATTSYTPPVIYPIIADKNVSVSTTSASAGTYVNVSVAFGYDAYVMVGGKRLVTITDRGGFTMPSGKVVIVTEDNGYLANAKTAAPNSYIFVYDSEMNHIKTNGSVKGIKGEGTVTVKLGEEYAGKTVTLYKGRKSTSVKLDSKTLDKNGNASFTVEGGKNYTAVVE